MGSKTRNHCEPRSEMVHVQSNECSEQNLSATKSTKDPDIEIHKPMGGNPDMYTNEDCINSMSININRNINMNISKNRNINMI